MDKLEISRQIGKGASSVVSLARDKSSGKQYALKVTEMDNNWSTVKREIEILSKLRHPHIVRYVRWFLHEGRLCVLFDYCECGTLDDQVIRYKQLRNSNYESDSNGDSACELSFPPGYIPEATIMRWFVQAAMALDYLHSRKVLHRDVKTRNVFLTRSNTVKLGDFGISKALKSTCSTTETCVGTPCYLSPELCRNRPYTAAADIWSFGCLLYELCALRCAFDASSIISLFHKIVRGDYDDIPLIYSIELSRLVHSLLAACPENRPTASAILTMKYVRYHLNEFVKREETTKASLDERRRMLRHYNSLRQDSASSCVSRLSLYSNASIDSKSANLLTTAPQTLSLEGAKRRGRGMYRQARVSQELLSPDVYQSEPALVKKQMLRAFSARADSASPTPPPISPLAYDENKLSALAPGVRSTRQNVSLDETYSVAATSPRPASAQPSFQDADRTEILKRSRVSPWISVSRAQSDTDDIPEELPPDGSDIYQSDYENEIEEILESESPDLELQKLRFHSREDFDLSENEFEWAEVIGKATQCLSARNPNRELNAQSTIDYATQANNVKSLKNCSKSLSV